MYQLYNALATVHTLGHMFTAMHKVIAAKQTAYTP